MATTVTLNGSNYSIPASGDDDWAGTSKVDGYLIALATGVLPKSGGSFTLTAEVDFGATYGVKSAYVKSRATNPASAGIVRLGNAESIKWRNAANSADLDLTVDSSNILNYNGAPVVTLSLGAGNTALVMNAGGTAYSWAEIVNANIAASAAIAYSKLNLATSIVNADVAAAAAIALTKLAATTASSALVSNASGFVSASAVTATELGYLSGVTSAVQTQLNTNASAISTNASNLTTHEADTSTHGVGVIVGTTEAQTLELKTLTSPVINTGVSGTAIKDEDTMVSDSATHLATQQSIKAYVDTQIASISSSGSQSSAKSADYTVTDIDNILTILMTTAGTTRVVTLPTAADNSGRRLTITKADTGVGFVTVDGEGAETINGLTTYTLYAKNDTVTIVCDGTSWTVTSAHHNWLAYTPTFAGNGSKGMTLKIAKWRRVGENCELMVSYAGDAVAAGAGATAVSITIPTGLTFSTTLSNAGSADYLFNNFGVIMTLGVTTSTSWDGQYLLIPSSSSATNTLGYMNSGGTAPSTQTDLNTARAMYFNYKADFPVAEWA